MHFRSGAAALKNYRPHLNKAFLREENWPSFIPDISRVLVFDLSLSVFWFPLI